MLLEKDGIPFVSSGGLARSGGLVHGFLGRKGITLKPLSVCRARDVSDEIHASYTRLAEVFRLQPLGPVTVNQVHGSSVFTVEEKGAGGPHPVEADSIVTNLPGVSLGVLTADCLPIVLFDPVKKAAGIVHVGSNPSDLVSALGPSIGPCCYEVDASVAGEFERAFGGRPKLKKLKNLKDLRLDIKEANLEQLVNSGLVRENISDEGLCTSCRNELFFSYRKEGPKAGRQISFVMIKE
jgi:copper oxidase (laccase) domain-containing protein